jgi:citrate synthase
VHVQPHGQRPQSQEQQAVVVDLERDHPPISASNDGEIYVRGFSLARELIGQLTFTEMFLLNLDGRPPSAGRVRVIDAVLVSLMEHGMTPSTLAARLVFDGAPDALQGAVAAGLLGVGSRFLGVVEQSAELLEGIVSSDSTPEHAAADRVREMIAAGGKIPGLGHNLHEDRDPRVLVLQRVAAAEGYAGIHSDALALVQRAASDQTQRPLIVNAAGAIGAILCDLGYPARQARGFAIVARAAGIFAHIVDEMTAPVARAVWVDAHETYSGSLMPEERSRDVEPKA